MRKYTAFVGMLTALAYMIAFAGCDEEPAVETCGSCHDDSSDILARQIQWQASAHATGDTFERSATNCASCHTSEGFREMLSMGGDPPPEAIAEDIDNPSPHNCRTCHQIHTNYDDSDFALTTETPVRIRLSGEVVDFGKGNLCAICHQPRVMESVLTVGGGDVEITSRRWGPHHGTQAAILGGTGGYEVPGSVAYVKQFVHKTLIDDGCVTCHMATAFGDKAGGHTMEMTYDSDTANTAGCVFCHADIETFDLNGTQTEIAGLLDELKALLMANNLIDDSDLAVLGTMSSDEAGSLMNYLLILEDGSLGVHNARYSRALLRNSIEALRR